MSKLAKALTAAAGNAGGDNLYVEDVFSTYLYTGTGSTQSINNGIDLDGEGGMVWSKARSASGGGNVWDTERGVRKYLETYNTSAESTSGTGAGLTSFNSDGFTLGTNWNTENFNGYNYASWTFRKAEKFFDIVTYTGNGVSGGREISHNLGSSPGFILIKRTDTQTAYSSWMSYHRAGSATGTVAFLNTTNFFFANSRSWFGDGSSAVAPTDTVFTINGGSSNYLNTSGATYIVYLFAHDAGGFGDDGDESIIKCGSYTGTGTVDTLSINLGFEPQWIMVKSATTAQSWYIQDVMRGMHVPATPSAPVAGKTLSANTSASESTNKKWFYPTATGVRAYDNEIEYNQSGQTYIYIAIRRPMKTPESGTEVFDPTVYTGNSSTQSITGFGFSPDLSILKSRIQGYPENVYDRLRGATKQLVTPYASAESTQSTGLTSFDQDGITIGALNQINTSAFSHISWNFKRATGFFDVVAYSGNGTAGATQAHNLGVVPELMIVKSRSNGAYNWMVYHHSLGNTNYLRLNETTQTLATAGAWNNTTPTDSEFTLGGASVTNGSGETFIAYLFATVAGVSKVGSYTGTGSNVDVDCGFSAGARFIFIKRTDSTGDWYVWDSERGIVAGNDPYLLLNSADAEVTSTDYIDPLSSGFTVTSSAPAALNASGGTYIFLAIA